MPKRPFLPENFTPPTKVVTKNFVLVPLHPSHNEIDYEAWSTSIPELRGVFGPTSDWPESVTGLDENLRDLEKHYAGFQARTECTYTILSPDEKRCLGCLYLRTPKTETEDCRVHFWLRTSDRARLETETLAFIKDWLATEWPFRSVFFAFSV